MTDEEFHVLRILGNGQISASRAKELIDDIRAGKNPELLPFTGSSNDASAEQVR